MVIAEKSMTLQRALAMANRLAQEATPLSYTARAAYHEARSQARKLSDPQALKLVARIEARLAGKDKSTRPIELE